MEGFEIVTFEVAEDDLNGLGEDVVEKLFLAVEAFHGDGFRFIAKEGAVERADVFEEG